MISVTTLRSQVLTLLTGLIGTYSYSNGDTAPALAVLPDPNKGWNYPLSDCVTTGIEVVITQPYPSVTPAYGGKVKPLRWDITLKQWNGDGSLLEAVAALIDGLDYLLSPLRLVPPNPNLGIIEQASFQILEWDF